MVTPRPRRPNYHSDQTSHPETGGLLMPTTTRAKETNMAQLTIRTHNEDSFTLNVPDDYTLPSLRAEGWVTIPGTDGKRLTLHSKSIASIWSVKEHA